MDEVMLKRFVFIFLFLLCGWPSFAGAQEKKGDDDDGTIKVNLDDDGEKAPEPEAPTLETEGDEKAETKTKPAKDDLERYYQVRESARRQIQSGQNQVHIYQLVEEMVDEVVADVDDLNANVVSPIAVRRIGLSPNLSQQFGQFVEATLVSNLANNTPMTLKRCVACESLRSRVEDGQWVVSLGLVEQKDLVREAKRLGVVAFLDAKFSWFPGANIVAMEVEITRAKDGAILWSETYRSDSTTAAILRTGDRVLTRRERVKELERKLEARPYYGHILYLGGSHIPYDSPQGGISGMAIGYRLYEKFGEDRRWMFGIGAEGFAKFGQNALLGSFVGAALHYELFARNLSSPTSRVGVAGEGFFAGNEGNSAAIEAMVDATLQFRLGLGASVMYFVPTKFAGYDLGGIGWKVRASFNW